MNVVYVTEILLLIHHDTIIVFTEMTANEGIENVPCMFPPGPRIYNIRESQCMLWCLQTQGCQSYNFLPLGGSTGTCMLVAPSLSNMYTTAEITAVLSQNGWIYHPSTYFHVYCP